MYLGEYEGFTRLLSQHKENIVYVNRVARFFNSLFNSGTWLERGLDHFYEEKSAPNSGILFEYIKLKIATSIREKTVGAIADELQDKFVKTFSGSHSANHEPGVQLFSKVLKCIKDMITISGPFSLEDSNPLFQETTKVLATHLDAYKYVLHRLALHLIRAYGMQQMEYKGTGHFWPQPLQDLVFLLLRVGTPEIKNEIYALDVMSANVAQ